jgi:hypothetical protein
MHLQDRHFPTISMTNKPSLTLQNPPLSQRSIFRTWWPLAFSWFLMALELPLLTAFVARMDTPEINLAAYGGVVFPIALLIEAPVIMWLAASTALCKDYATYLTLRKYMLFMSASLTLLHLLLAFTPLYDFLAVNILSVPAEIVEPARIGLRIMTPWTWSIAYRRFNQGVLIRFGHSGAVGVGTIVRLAADTSVLVIGFSIGSVPGIVVGTSAVIAGVIAEALYTGVRIRPVISEQVRPAPPVGVPITLPGFLDFYIPLALTSLILLLIQPMGSAGLSRMPFALESLAAWPVVSGLVFMLRSFGMAYNEVVVALLDESRAIISLRRFALILALSTTGLLVLFKVTPLAAFWFGSLSALPEDLLLLASNSLWLALLLPGLNVAQSWFQGVLVHQRKTRGVTEAVVFFVLISGFILVLGVRVGEIPGIYVGWIAFSIGSIAQTIWLWLRSRGPIKELEQEPLPAGALVPN